MNNTQKDRREDGVARGHSDYYCGSTTLYIKRFRVFGGKNDLNPFFHL